jgi:multisubunit Na+/H+ antiporter MnhG subunit
MILSRMNEQFKSFAAELRIRQYYAGDINRSSSLPGMLLDFVFLRVLVFVAVYLIILYISRQPVFSFVTSLALTLILSMILHKRGKAIYKAKRDQKRKDIAREYMSSRLLSLSPQEFRWQIVKLLSNSNGFSCVKSCKKMAEAVFKGRRTAICIHHSSNGRYAGPDDMSRFINVLRSDSYRAGLFFSSTQFKDICHNIAKEKISVPVKLIDMPIILDMMEIAGMFPDDQSIDHLISEEVKKNVQRWKDIKQQVLTPQKVRHYTFYGVVCLAVSILTGSLRIYYVLLSMFFFLLAALTHLVIPKTHGKRELLSNITSSGESIDEEGFA